MHAHIFKQRKNAMQSGRFNLKPWYMTIEHTPYSINPLTGWVSGDNTNQITLQFETKEQAINYAKEEKYTFEVHPDIERHVRPKSYCDNFLNTRHNPWTH